MAALQDICLLITDGKHGDCQNEDGSGFYFVSCKDVKDGWIDYSDARQITEADYLDTHRRTHLEANDIVITNSGTIGRMAIVSNTPETNCTTFQKSVAIVKPNPEKVIAKWLYYSLMANRDSLVAWASGTAQKNLLLRDMRAYNIDVPPRPIQRKIAAILSAYDDLIENNTRRIKIQEEMVQSLYSEWFVNFRFPGHEKVRMVNSPLGEIPEWWKMVTVKDISSYINRGIRPNYNDKSEYIVINQKCIRDRKLNLEPSRRHLSKVSKDQFIQFGDILINSTGVGTLGRVAQIYQELSNSTVDSHVSIVRPKNNVTIDYFGLNLLNRQDHFESLGMGSTGQSELNRDSIANSDFLLPPMSLQLRFTSIVEPMRKNMICMLNKNYNLRRTRDLLLPKLISGELNVETIDIKTEGMTS